MPEEVIRSQYIEKAQYLRRACVLIPCHYLSFSEPFDIFSISVLQGHGCGSRDRAVLTPEAAGIKKSARGAVALLLADLARREHRQPEMRPQTSPRKDKSTALRATHSPATATEGGTQG